MSEFDHLWNDLPFEERSRLAPYQIQSQIRDLRQARKLMVRNHKRALAELDEWIGNLENKLPSPERESGQ